MTSPSPNGDNGGRHAATGRFAPGWKGGPGNPHAKQVGQLRSALMAAVKPKDMLAIAGRLVQMAKDGDDLVERLERLEELLMNGQLR